MVGEVVSMFVEQIPTIGLLDRVLEGGVGALVDTRHRGGGPGRVLPVQVGLGSPEAEL